MKSYFPLVTLQTQTYVCDKVYTVKIQFLAKGVEVPDSRSRLQVRIGSSAVVIIKSHEASRPLVHITSLNQNIIREIDMQLPKPPTSVRQPSDQLLLLSRWGTTARRTGIIAGNTAMIGPMRHSRCIKASAGVDGKGNPGVNTL